MAGAQERPIEHPPAPDGNFSLPVGDDVNSLEVLPNCLRNQICESRELFGRPAG